MTWGSKVRHGSARHRGQHHDINTRDAGHVPIRMGTAPGLLRVTELPRWPTWRVPAASTSPLATTSPRWSMLILGKARAEDGTKGYAATFLQHLDAALEHLVADGIRLVVNAGELQPRRAGRRNARTDRAPRLRPRRLPHRRRRRLLLASTLSQQAGHSLPHLASGEPLSSWPHQPLSRQRLPGGIRHRAGAGRRRRHRHHRPGRRCLCGRRSRRLVVELDPE